MNAAKLLLAQRAEEVRAALNAAHAEAVAAMEYHDQKSRERDALQRELDDLEDGIAQIETTERSQAMVRAFDQGGISRGVVMARLFPSAVDAAMGAEQDAAIAAVTVGPFPTSPTAVNL